MKNFLRALRHALPYRRRLIGSFVAAFLAAVLWGLNFTSIYPVLKLLGTGQSHASVDRRPHRHDPERHRTLAEGKRRAVPAGSGSGETPRLPTQSPDRNASSTNTCSAWIPTSRPHAHRVYWYQVLRRWIFALLPDDCFSTLACVIGLVVAGIIVKCFFEFGQESLVGSVVNLSLFDLRNRFYRNVIHLDVDPVRRRRAPRELMARFTNDMESLGAGMKTLFGKVVAEPLRVVACVVIACCISWQLTFLFLILVPIAVLILYRSAGS